MIKRYVKIVIFGFFIWLIPFLISFIIFPLRSSNRPFFESIMAVVVTFSVVVFSILYFKKSEQKILWESIFVGVFWFLMSLIIDLLLFLPASPMHMDLMEYMMDIGFTYLIILMIPIGFGVLLQKKRISSF